MFVLFEYDMDSNEKIVKGVTKHSLVAVTWSDKGPDYNYEKDMKYDQNAIEYDTVESIKKVW